MNGASALARIILQAFCNSKPVLFEIKAFFLNREPTAQIYEFEIREVIGERQSLVHARQQVFKRGNVRSQVDVSSDEFQIVFLGNLEDFRQLRLEHSDAALCANKYIVLRFLIAVEAYAQGITRMLL